MRLPPRRCGGRLPPVASWLRRLRRSAKRSIASTRSSSVDELERVDAGLARTRARSVRLALLARLRAKRLRKPRSCVSTKSCSPVSASCITQQAEVGQLHLERIVAAAPRRPRGAARAARAARSQPGALMKSETTNTSERRGITCARRRAAARRRSVAPRRGARRPRLHRGAAGAARGAGRCAPGSRASTLVAVEQRADAVAVARQQPRQHGDEARPTPRACCTRREPKSTDALRVEQEPRGDLAVLVVLAHVGRLQPRGDVPVDVAHVVVDTGTRAGRRGRGRSRGTACGSRPAAGRRGGACTVHSSRAAGSASGVARASVGHGSRSGFSGAGDAAA